MFFREIQKFPDGGLGAGIGDAVGFDQAALRRGDVRIIVEKIRRGNRENTAEGSDRGTLQVHYETLLVFVDGGSLDADLAGQVLHRHVMLLSEETDLFS